MYAIDSRSAEIYVDGEARAPGANNGDWRHGSVIQLMADLTCVAFRAVNDEPGTNWAGFIATLTLSNGSTVVSDGGWRAFVGGVPPADAQGRAWYEPGYDDSVWRVPTVQGPCGCAPWGKQAGLADLVGASWIWPGDPARGVSPVYLRRRAVPTATARRE